MPTKHRVRRHIDMGRLREALRGPGVDTRVWVVTARIDDDPDAIWWDSEFGWLVDVTVYGGGLDQEGPITCRVASSFAGNAYTRVDPFARGEDVLVAVPDGDANANPVIIGSIHSAENVPPVAVNGQLLDEVLAAANHVLKSPRGEQTELGGDREVTAQNQTVVALEAAIVAATQSIYLARAKDVPPVQQAVLGNALVVAQAQLITALATFVAALAVGAPLSPVLIGTVQTAAGPLGTAFNAYLTALNGTLSQLVRLD